MVKEYKESDLDHREKEKMPLIARQAVVLGAILLIAFIIAMFST